jgi:hypothetical protein
MQLWGDKSKPDIWLRLTGYGSESKPCGPNGTDIDSD